MNFLKLSSEKDELLVYSVKENSPIGTIVGYINIPGFLPLTTIHESQENNIIISKESGIISVLKPLDREKRATYSFLLISSNGETKTLKVNIQDENDNSPKFNVTSLEKIIPENNPIGSKVDLTLVYDPDEGVNSIESIVIASGDPEGHFSVDYYNRGDGYFYLRLVLMRQLDYEITSLYNLVIQANDGGSPRRQASLFLKIVVDNANDNAPRFDLSRYVALLREDQKLGTVVTQVHATDRDAGPAGQLTYFLDLNSADSQFFSINPRDGEVLLKTSLDYERKHQLSLSVAVRDNVLPYHTSRASLIVDVTDVNDNPPSIHVTFPQQRPEIDLNSAPNSLVAHISVVDLDSVSTQFTLHIVNNSMLQVTKILPKLWQLTTTERLRSYTADNINLTLQATDYPPPSLTTTLTINLSIKRTVPITWRLERKEYVVELSSPVSNAGQNITTIFLKDHQLIGNAGIVYSLSGDEAHLFSIGPVDGTVTSRARIDCGRYRMMVTLHTARNAVPIDTAMITVIIRGSRKSGLYFKEGFHRILLTKTATGHQCTNEILVANMHCNKEVTYKIESLVRDKSRSFQIGYSGDICYDGNINVMKTQRYFYKIIASEKNSVDVSTNAMFVRVSKLGELRLLNREIFATLSPFNESIPVARVIATFLNQPAYLYYGVIQYTMKPMSTIAANSVRVDPISGELYASIRGDSDIVFEIVPRVNNEVVSTHTVQVTLSFSASKRFSKSLYEFHASQDQLSQGEIIIGKVSLVTPSLEDGGVTYHLAQSNHGSINLSIDSSTGIVRARNSAPQSIVISTTVFAKLHGAKVCYAQVLVMIDNAASAPSIDVTSLEANIWENAPLGTELVQMIPTSASWSDHWSISYGRFSDWFSIHSKSGQIFLRKPLDRERIARAVLTIELSNKWGTVKANVNINILDNNDNTPTCSASIVNVTLRDSAAVGELVCPLHCTDDDTLDNGNLTYGMAMMAPDGLSSPLSIHEVTGCLRVDSSLDLWRRSPRGVLIYSVTVSDNGRDGSLYTMVTIFVRIIDTNNHAPSLISYHVFHVQENAAPGTVVGKLILDDEDPNDRLSVSVNEGPHSHWLYTEAATSRNVFVLRTHGTRGVLVGSHKVTLRMWDDGSPGRWTLVNVSVTVHDANDHDPEIRYPIANANISFPCPMIPGSPLFVMKASDRDHGVNAILNYFIEDDVTGGVFVMDRWLGILTTRRQPSCTDVTRLRISVKDMGHPRLNATVTVFMTPSINRDLSSKTLPTNLYFIIPANAERGTILGILRIDSRDQLLGTKFLFGGTSTVSADAVLEIDYDSQRLTLLRPDLINFKTTMYPITAVYHRARVPPRTFEFQMHLQRHTIVFSWPVLPDDVSVIKVKENEPPGTLVAYFPSPVTEDSAVAYFLRQSRDYFAIDPRRGTVVTFVSLDRESIYYDEFPIEVIATDLSDPRRSSVIPLLVVIEDVNDNPPTIISPLNTTIEVTLDDMIRNRSVVKVVAIDVDKGSNGQVKYFITDSELFIIDPVTGSMWMTRMPQTLKSDVNVSVTDMGVPPLTSWRVLSFRFQPSNVQDKIRFLSRIIPLNLSITPDQRPSTLGQVSLADAGMLSNPGAVRFHLIAGQFSHLFEIDPVTGRVSSSRRILPSDIGITDTLKLSVVAFLLSDAYNYDIANLVVHIDHGNKHAPSFAKSKYSVKLPEGEAITDFLIMAADDPDLGNYGVVTYELLGDIDDRRISIDPHSGRLSCGALNHLARKFYNLEVVATDSFGGPLSRNRSAFLQIEVLNSLQQSIEFNSSHFVIRVKENQPQGTVLGSITISANPPRSQVIYLLNPGHPLIAINSTTGLLVTNGAIDRETIQFIDLTIYAMSRDPETETVQSTKSSVNIIISDVNDNAPIPSQNPFIVYILDPDEVKSPITTISVTDPDTVTNLSFHLDLTDQMTQSLSPQYLLDSSSGVIKYRFRAMKPGFREHILRVIVSDNGSPPQTTKVVVYITLDRRFLTVEPEKAVFRLDENPPFGAPIGQMTVGGNCTSGQMDFTVIDGRNKDLVYLHITSGKLFVASASRLIDYETTKEIVLWTQVRCLNTDLIGFKKVVVQVVDVDDNRPMFSQKEYEAFVLEGQPPRTAVLRTIIYDPDEGVNSQVEYFIEMYSLLDEFSIDSDGTIRTNLPLNFHTKSLYNLVVKATSKFTPLLFAECRVTVHVINVNDQRPLFSSPVQSIRISERQPVGSLLKTITATDSDGKNRISYRIRPRSMSTNGNRFLSIGYDSGDIYLSKRLTTSDVGRHEVDVVADDGKYSSSTIFVVEVTDVNNQYPVMVEDGEHYVVTETLPPDSVIAHLHASDGDQGANGQVSFTIWPPLTWLSLKDFNNNSAALYLVSTPKFSSNVQFVGIQLTDKAIDSTERLSSVSTIALITDSSNAHAPQFLNGSQIALTIVDTTPIGSKVAYVHCRDAEDQVSYWINSTSVPSPLHIDLVSGDIFLIESLEHYIRPNFEEILLCLDKGKPPRRTSSILTVNIERSAKRPAKLIYDIENITIEVSELSTYPLFVQNLRKTGKHRWDSRGIRVLSAVPTKPMSDYKWPAAFHVDRSSNLWLNNSVERSSWRLLLRVSDGSSGGEHPGDLDLACYIRTTVIITDRQADQLPCVSIDKLTAVIKENEPPSTVVLNLPMWYSDIRYRMTDDEHFAISCTNRRGSSCQILSQAVLDFERNEKYDLILTVSGTSSTTQSCSHTLVVGIYVLDVDEFTPVFSQSEYSYTVLGGVPNAGQVLFTVSASDSDRGRYGLVYYQLEGSSDYGHFAIDNSTGDIFVHTPFPSMNDSQARVKRSERSTTDKDSPGVHHKVFSLNIIASSGDRSTTVNVRLKVLVPLVPEDDKARIKLSWSHIALIISLFVLLLIIGGVVVYIYRKRCRHQDHRLINNNQSMQYHSPSKKTSEDQWHDSSPNSTDYGVGCPLPYQSTQLACPDLLRSDKLMGQGNEMSGSPYTNVNSLRRHPQEVIHLSAQSSGFRDHSYQDEMSAPHNYFHRQSSQANNLYIDNNNNNNNHHRRYANAMNRDRYRDSDLSGTSSSCYSTISQNLLPAANQYGSMEMERIRTNPKIQNHRRKDLTASSGQLKQGREHPEFIPLTTMASNCQRSYTNIGQNMRQYVPPSEAGLDAEQYREDAQYSGCESVGATCMVLSVHEPSSSAISNHSHSSSIRQDTSNAQTYSDLTDC